MRKEEILKCAERLAELEELDIIKEYNDVFTNLVNYPKGEPELEYYKSSDLYDYYIELPYKKFIRRDGKYQFVQHYCSYIGRQKGKSSGWVINACLSLCGYSKEEIMERIDEVIIEDNRFYRYEVEDC